MMAIFCRVLLIVLLLAFWFFICSLLWSQLIPLETIYWISHKLAIYGDEGVYDLAASIGIAISCIGSVVLTMLSMKLICQKK